MLITFRSLVESDIDTAEVDMKKRVAILEEQIEKDRLIAQLLGMDLKGLEDLQQPKTEAAKPEVPLQVPDSELGMSFGALMEHFHSQPQNVSEKALTRWKTLGPIDFKTWLLTKKV